MAAEVAVPAVPVPVERARVDAARPVARSIEWHLGALCVLLAVPILAFVGWLLWQYGGAERLRLERQGAERLHKIAAAVERDLAVQSAMTELAGYSPPMQSDDLSAIDRAARELARALDILVVLRRPDGSPIVHTGTPPGTALPAARRDEDALVLERRRPVASNLFEDPVAGGPLIAITAPVLRPGTGAVAFLLTLAFRPERILQAMAPESGAGTLTLVLDGAGRVIASSRPEEVAVGRALPALAAAASAPAGPFRASIPDGEPVVAHHARLSGADWTVVVATTEETLQAPLRRFLLQLLGVGLALGLLSPVLAWTFGRRITGAMRELRDGAVRLGGGRPVPALETPVTQVNEVAAALRAAAREIEDGRDRLNLLNRELQHRVKNNLATVQAVIGATARGTTSVEEFHHALLQRIRSLSETHDLLSGGAAAAASFAALVEKELRPYADAGEDRVTLCGEDLPLSAAVAVPVGMIVHELATNAVKYGALAAPGGRLAVTWNTVERCGRIAFTVEWRESDVPSVAPPEGEGFGSVLLARIARQLDAVLERDYSPAGLTVRLTVPLEPADPGGRP